MKKIDFNRDKQKYKKGVITRPVVNLLMKIGVCPNVVSFAGFLCGVVSVYFLFCSRFLFIIFQLLHFAFDNIDGDLARASGKVTQLGNLIDKGGDGIQGGLLLLKYYYVTHDQLGVCALILFLFHNVLALLTFKRKIYATYLCPSVSFARIMFVLGFYKPGIIGQVIYSPAAYILFFILYCLGVIVV